MAEWDVEFPAREEHPLAAEEYPQPRPETEFRLPDAAAEDAAPPGEDYAAPDWRAEFSPPGSGGAETAAPKGKRRRIRRLLYGAFALVLLGLIFSRSDAALPYPFATPSVTAPGDALAPGQTDAPSPEPTAEPTPEPLGREPVIETDFFAFSHAHYARLRLRNTAALHSVRVGVRDTVLDKPVYEHYLSDEEIAAGGFELPMLSTGDLYEANMDAYSEVNGWPHFEMEITAWYENESGDGEDTLTLTLEPEFELGVSLSYMQPDHSWYESVPPDSFYVRPWEEGVDYRYVINDPDAVTDPLTFSVDLSWNGRHAAPEEYEESVDKQEYTIINDEGGETPHVSYTRQLVLRRPSWMPETGTLHVHIVQRLASTGELWIRDYDYDFPQRYDWES